MAGALVVGTAAGARVDVVDGRAAGGVVTRAALVEVTLSAVVADRLSVVVVRRIVVVVRSPAAIRSRSSGEVVAKATTTRPTIRGMFNAERIVAMRLLPRFGSCVPGGVFGRDTASSRPTTAPMIGRQRKDEIANTTAKVACLRPSLSVDVGSTSRLLPLSRQPLLLHVELSTVIALNEPSSDGVVSAPTRAIDETPRRDDLQARATMGRWRQRDSDPGPAPTRRFGALPPSSLGWWDPTTHGLGEELTMRSQTSSETRASKRAGVNHASTTWSLGVTSSVGQSAGSSG